MARKSRFTPDQRAALRKARQKKQERYWENRSQSRVLATDRQGDKAQAEQKRAYEDAKKSVRQEIEKFYEKFSDETGIDSQMARKNLSNRELDDFKKELARKRKVIKEMLAKDPNNDKLRAYDTEFERLSKVRALTRRESLEANIKAEIVKLGGTQDQQINARSNNVVNTALWMNSADLSMLGDVDTKLGVGHPEQVRRAAEENWQHGDFSDKIWSDKEKLIDETRNVLTRAFVHHDGAIDTARRLSSKMNASESNALRLVRTEFNHLSNQAALAEYQAKGIKKYKFVAAIDSRTSDICRELDGQVFNVADAKTGLNFPPMHPNCRSVTTPVIDWDDEDEWDYSGIELDDDELKQLGLTDEDVAEIDSNDARSARLSDAPAPSLTVQQANQATEDTQSVQRRAEQAEAVKQQGEAIEIKARNLYDKDIGNIFDDIDRNEKLNQKLYVDTPITLPQAAIEAENLDRVHIDIQKADLEALKLQARAAKLDESIPKPDPKRTADLEDAIERQKKARDKRRAADLPDDEVIAKAMPRAFELPEATPEAAIEPRTAFGKWWQKVRDGVERAKERFNACVSGFGQNLNVARMAKPDAINLQDVDDSWDEKQKKAFDSAIDILKAEREKKGNHFPQTSQKRLEYYEIILKECAKLPSKELADKAFGKMQEFERKFGKPIAVHFAATKGELVTKGSGEFDAYSGPNGTVRIMFNAKPHAAVHEISHAKHYQEAPYAYRDIRADLAEQLGVDMNSLSPEDGAVLNKLYEAEKARLLKEDQFVQAANRDWAKMRKAYGFTEEWTADSAKQFMDKFRKELLTEVFNGKQEYDLNETERTKFLAFQDIVCSFAHNKQFQSGHRYEEYGDFQIEAVADIEQLLDYGDKSIIKILENRFGDFLIKILQNLNNF